MEIFIIDHYYSNGETLEDYRSFLDYECYSSYEIALSKFHEYTSDSWEGAYVLRRVVLDTQETWVIEESEYKPCIPKIEDPDLPEDYDDTSYWEDYGEE